MNESTNREGSAPPPGAPAEDADARRAGGAPLLVLKLIRPLAVLAIAALILGRALGPSWAGIAVGMDRVIWGMEIFGGALTQLFAMAALVVAMAEITAAVRAPIPIDLRFGAVAIAGFAIIVGLFASVIRAPAFAMATAGAGAALLAIGAAWESRRAPFARPAALVLGLIGVGALLRLVSVAIAFTADERASVPLINVARGVATGSLVIDACAILVAMAVLSVGGRKLASPLTMGALVGALIITRQALVGANEDAGMASLLLRRATERLMTRPEPFVPVPLRTFVSVLAVLVALATLFGRRQIPALVGAVALLLVARGSADAPLGALTLVIASIAVALAAKDDRGMWAAIQAGQVTSGRSSDPDVLPVKAPPPAVPAGEAPTEPAPESGSKKA